MLPVVLPPYEDEAIHSWLERLAIANGCSSLDQLLDSFSPSSKSKVICARSYIAFILEAAEIENWAEFYVTHTEYPLVAPVSNDYYQIKLLDASFTVHDVKLLADVRQLLVCPECQKENPYLRVWHNLPGVKVCYKHKKTLVPVKSGLQLVESAESPVSVGDVEYAKYCHDLHATNLPYSVSYINRILDGTNSSQRIRTTENAIRELMVKYPNVDDIPKQIVRNEPLPSGYTLVHQCGSVLEVQHECGTRYCITAKGLQSGFYCPSCSSHLNESERIEGYINAAGNGEYKLIERLNRKGKNIRLLHRGCGVVYEDTLTNFLSGARCKCERIRTIEALRIQFASEYPEYVPILRQGKRITIRHNKCGREFDLVWKDWVRKPACRYCFPTIVLTDDYMRQQLEEIGLELISINEGSSGKPKVTVKCNQGHQSLAQYHYLRELGDCPQCMYSRDHFSSNLIVKYLKENYQNNLFFYDDLSDMFGSVKTKHAIQLLRNTKQIVAIAPQCYTFSDNGKEYTEREIITQKYLRRGDETIGYLYGQSFSYYVLGIGEEPETVSIATKKYASPKGNLVHYSNSTLRLRRVPEGLNEENWKAVQVADFIDGIYLFLGSATQHLDVLLQYIEDNNISKPEIVSYITNPRTVIQDIKRRLLE